MAKAGLEEGLVHQRILEAKLGAVGRSVSREVQDRDPAKPRQLYVTHVVLKLLESSVFVSPGFRCLYSGTRLLRKVHTYVPYEMEIREISIIMIHGHDV